jgi:hypothetical protein
MSRRGDLKCFRGHLLVTVSGRIPRGGPRLHAACFIENSVRAFPVRTEV